MYYYLKHIFNNEFLKVIKKDVFIKNKLQWRYLILNFNKSNLKTVLPLGGNT